MHRALGRGYALLGSFEEGQPHLHQAVAGFRKLGNRTDEARAHIDMGLTLRVKGCYGDALSQARKALRLYRAAGHSGGQAGALNNIGLYHVYLGNYQEALACCQKALAVFSELGNRHGVAHVLDSLGYLYHFLGQSTEAITFCQQSLDAFREYGDRFSQADTLVHLGDTHHATGNQKAAHRAWQAALSILIELHHPDASHVHAKLTNPGDGPKLGEVTLHATVLPALSPVLPARSLSDPISPGTARSVGAGNPEGMWRKAGLSVHNVNLMWGTASIERPTTGTSTAFNLAKALATLEKALTIYREAALWPDEHELGSGCKLLPG